MTRKFDSIAMAAVLVLSASLAGVVVAAPLAAGTAEASTASASPHGADANFTAKPDNHAPETTTANEFYASGLREEMTMHTIVVRSEAFDFDTCSASQVRAFGIDRGNDNSGTETDESLLGSYKSISFEKNQITVKFYKEDKLAGGPVKVAPEDQIVARGDDCLTNPSEPGWYQISGKINGSTNDNTKTDFSQTTSSHYVYVCDCENRQEAEEKLGPPPSQEGSGDSDESEGDGGTSDTATATPTESSGDTGEDEGDGGTSDTATPTESSGDTGEGDGDTSATATPTDSGNRESQGTPTTTAGAGDTGNSTNTTSTSGDGTGTNATSTGGTGGDGTTGNASTGNESGGGGFASNESENESTTPSGGQPGFGLLAALGALGVAGLLAKRRRD